MKQILEFKRGDTIPLRVEITHDDGTPFDLTGYTVLLVARSKYSDATPLISRAASVVAPLTGVGIATLLPGDTTPLPNNVDTWLVFDVQLEKGADRYTPIYGDIKILREVAQT